jgi:hypothetical protein
MSYQTIVVGLFVDPPIIATQRLAKDVTVTIKNSCSRRFLCGPCRIKGKYTIICSKDFLFVFPLMISCLFASYISTYQCPLELIIYLLLVTLAPTTELRSI